MFGLKLSHVFNESPLTQLQMIARRKPTLLLGTLFSATLLTLSTDLGTVAQMAVGSIGLVSAATLVKEYGRLLHLYFKNKKVKKTFDEKSIMLENEKCVSLRYEDNLPICTIHTTNPYLAGKAIALLMPEQIIETIDRFYGLLPYTMQMLHLLTPSARLNIHGFLEDEIKKLQPTLPEYVDKQLDGMIDQLRKWVAQDNKRWVYQRPLPTKDELIKFIVLPDVCKMLGCSAAIKRDEQHNIEIWRNLDWPSLGVIHEQTMLLVSNLGQTAPGKPKATASVTFTPGIAGLSLTNDKGLTVTINEATHMRSKRHQPGGIPEILHTREIVRNCSTLNDVDVFLSQSKPLTSHILTIMDGQGQGAIYQILPPNSKKMFTKRAMEPHRAHIAVTNHHIDKRGDMIDESASWPDSLDRFVKVTKALENEKRGYNTLRRVQQRVTVHSLIFSNTQPEDGPLEQSVRVRAHAAYSANKELPCSHVNVSEAFKHL